MSNRSSASVYLSKWPKSSDTHKTMRSALDSIAAVLGGNDAESYHWHELRYETVRGIPALLTGAGNAPRTVNKALCALRGVLETAWRQGALLDEHYRKIEVESVRGKRDAAGNPLTDAEMDAVMAAVSMTDGRDAAMVAFLMAFGIRRVELVRLEHGDYDAKVGELLARGKGDKERRIPVLPDWRNAVERWWRAAPADGPIFRENGKPLTRRQVSYAVERFCKAAKIHRFTPHDARRTYATRLLLAGVDVLTVKQLMGHESVDTTGIYDRRGEEAKRSAVSKIRRGERQRGVE